MHNCNYSAPLIKSLVKNKSFVKDPFILLDVGCSGGIDPAWRLFENQILVHGFDPRISEIEYLRKHEKNPNYFYHDFFVCLPDNHTFKKSKIAFEQNELSEYFNPCAPWRRSSAPLISSLQNKSTLATFSSDRTLSKNSIGLDEFIAKTSLKNVDFIKIDTDGADLEALMSCEKNLSGARNILGFMVEVNWSGSANPFCNAYHNIDRLLKQHGYNPFAISMTRYTKAALPGQFVLNFPAQTQTGRPVQGDVIFLLDAASADFEKATKRSLSDIQILKLACLFDLFNLPDCAAELILKYKERLQKTQNISSLMDILAREFNPNCESYEHYISNINNHPSSLFPDQNTQQHAISSRKKPLAKIMSYLKRKKSK